MIWIVIALVSPFNGQLLKLQVRIFGKVSQKNTNSTFGPLIITQLNYIVYKVY